MSGRLSIFFGWVHEIGGRVYDFLNSREVENEVTTTGDKAGNEQFITVGGVSTVEVYNWFKEGGKTGGASPGDFEVFALQIRGEGNLWVIAIVDAPTSATDLRPAGTAQRAVFLGELSNHGPFVLTSDQMRVEPTATVAKTYTITGYSTATGTGTPDIIASTTDVEGKIYSILVYNPAAVDLDDDDVDQNAVTLVKGHAN